MLDLERNNDTNVADEIKKILESDDNNNSNLFPFIALFFMLLKGNDIGADYWRGKYDAYKEIFKDCDMKTMGGDIIGKAEKESN